jgi:hypothetical protein
MKKISSWSVLSSQEGGESWVRKGRNVGESLRRLKPTVGCNANKRRRSHDASSTDLEVLPPVFSLQFTSLLLKLWCSLLQCIWNIVLCVLCSTTITLLQCNAYHISTRIFLFRYFLMNVLNKMVTATWWQMQSWIHINSLLNDTASNSN